jgi:hypothetical protein
MKEFNVAIDFESWNTVIKAETPEEATQMALDEYIRLRKEDNEIPDFWVGDVSEVV